MIIPSKSKTLITLDGTFDCVKVLQCENSKVVVNLILSMAKFLDSREVRGLETIKVGVSQKKTLVQKFRVSEFLIYYLPFS